MTDTLTIAGKSYASRLIIGTGKYKTYAENAAALEASGAEIVTVAVRRVNLDRQIGLQRELGLSYVLITHDLDVVHRIAHRTAVMLQGQFVAFDQTDKIFDNPEHAYTQKLITAVPEMRVDWLDEVLAMRAAA
jgi:ABC-type glutathione transport system ATPase component